jgi:hypothetical protein
MKDARNQLVMDFSPATRNSHPDTSKEAEKKITKQGRASHCQIVLNCLRIHNGATAAELALYLEPILKDSQVWKRLADLAHNGYVKRDDVNIRDNRCVWWIL